MAPVQQTNCFPHAKLSSKTICWNSWFLAHFVVIWTNKDSSWKASSWQYKKRQLAWKSVRRTSTYTGAKIGSLGLNKIQCLKKIKSVFWGEHITEKWRGGGCKYVYTPYWIIKTQPQRSRFFPPLLLWKEYP